MRPTQRRFSQGATALHTRGTVFFWGGGLCEWRGTHERDEGSEECEYDSERERVWHIVFGWVAE